MKKTIVVLVVLSVLAFGLIHVGASTMLVRHNISGTAPTHGVFNYSFVAPVLYEYPSGVPTYLYPAENLKPVASPPSNELYIIGNTSRWISGMTANYQIYTERFNKTTQYGEYKYYVW